MQIERSILYKWSNSWGIFGADKDVFFSIVLWKEKLFVSDLTFFGKDCRIFSKFLFLPKIVFWALGSFVVLKGNYKKMVNKIIYYLLY